MFCVLLQEVHWKCTCTHMIAELGLGSGTTIPHWGNWLSCVKMLRDSSISESVRTKSRVRIQHGGVHTSKA